MRSNIDLIFFIIGIGLIWWGFETIVKAGQKLDIKYVVISKKLRVMNTFQFLLMLSPLAVAYILIGEFPDYAVEILMAVLFLFFSGLGIGYLFGVHRLMKAGFPDTYINKYRIGAVLMNIGILFVIGIQLFRLVQRFG